MGRKTFFRRVQGGREPSIAATNNGNIKDLFRQCRALRSLFSAGTPAAS